MSIKKSDKIWLHKKVEWRKKPYEKCIVQSHLQRVRDCIEDMVTNIGQNIFGKTKKVIAKPQKIRVQRVRALRKVIKYSCLEKWNGEKSVSKNVLCKVVCNAYSTASTIW